MDHLAGFQSLRATMERCSEIVSDSYAFKPEELFQFEGELPPNHNAGHRRQRYWVKQVDGDLVVSLPGTTHPMDWSSNMRVHYTPIDGTHPPASTPTQQLEQTPCAHAGFYFRAETIPTLALLEQAAAKGLRLVLTGHSLGAAVANVCTLTALTAQRKAREAAANAAFAKHTAATAAASASQQSSNSSSSSSSPEQRREKKKKPSPFHAAANAVSVAVAEAHTNHSWCSANSDILVSPQAALVEVLCVAFASPHWANQALADHIEDNDWGEAFVNVVVPEDYCLNLFNNVLTSANTAERHTLSRTNSKCSMRDHSSGTRLSDDAEDEQTCCPEPLDAFTSDSLQDTSDPTGLDKDLMLSGMGSNDSTATVSSTADSTTTASSSSSSSSGLPPRYSYQPSAQQQQLLSALAGTRRKQSRKLSFALPDRAAPVPAPLVVVASAAVADTTGSSPAAIAAAAAAAAGRKSAVDLRKPPAVSVPCSSGLPPMYVETGSWNELRAALPASPSCASLSSLSSLNSTRSWTLMAYLPDVLIRTFSNGSSSSSADDASSRASSDGGCPDAAADAIAAMFAGPDVAYAPVPPAAAVAAAAVEAVLQPPPVAAVSAVMEPTAAAAAAAVIASRRRSSSGGFGMRHAKSAVDLSVGSLSDSNTSSSSTANDSLNDSVLTGAAGDAAQLGIGSAAARAQGLRRSLTSASLKSLGGKSPQKLLTSLKLSSSLAMVGSLLPSLRAMVHASRAVLNTASNIKEAAFNVPLSVFEAGLIKALKPPMYKPVGQQWILSATGLVPQQQPIHMYPKHLSDVYWHKDLALVAFREHSIVFYKARLLQQARRR